MKCPDCSFEFMAIVFEGITGTECPKCGKKIKY